jgi:hypothetical protein
MTIGVYMEERLRLYGRGGFDAALGETQTRFEIKSSATVAKALKYLREQLNQGEGSPGWQSWDRLREEYFTPKR